MSVVLPERDVERPLELAEDRILGAHIPTGFVLRHRRATRVYGEIITQPEKLRVFYRRLGYHVIDLDRGLRILPSRRSLARLDPEERALGATVEIFATHARTQWWALQIHARAPTVARGATRSDPIAYVFTGPGGVAHELAGAPRPAPPDRPETRGGTLGAVHPRPAAYKASRSASSPGARSKTRRPSHDVRSAIRAWIKAHPGETFRD